MAFWRVVKACFALGGALSGSGYLRFFFFTSLYSDRYSTFYYMYFRLTFP